jgi:putative SOS response-associated peptidase YedK
MEKWFMCANSVPVTSTDRLLTFFGVSRTRSGPTADVFPSGLAPMIRLAPDDGSMPPERIVDDAIFRMVPDFIAKVDWARKTYNARSETVDSKASYAPAWRAGQRCIIPTEGFYEPNYETSKPVRWAFNLPGGMPMGIAGIYKPWTTPDGREVFAMAMLTVNADDHPLMNWFHAPGDEKRMVVILDPSDYSDWLACPVPEAKHYLKQWRGPLEAHPAPLPPRVPKAGSAATSATKPARPITAKVTKSIPPVAPQNGELF